MPYDNVPNPGMGMYGAPNPAPVYSYVYANPNPAPYGYTNMNYGYSAPNTMPSQSREASKPGQLPIRGRVVNTFEEIVPNEVPMDGSWSFFPKSDGTAVVAKAWKSDGTIQTNVYNIQKEEPVEQNAQNSQESAYNTIIDRLDRIEKSLRQKKFYPAQPKKEGQVNE